MKKRNVLIVGVLMLLLAAAQVPAQETTDGPVAPRYRNFDSAIAKAAEVNKLVLVDFYTDWCKYCKMIDTIVFTDQAAIDYFTNEMILAQINAEVDTLLAQKYHVSGYPTLVLIDSNGDEVDRIVGYMPTNNFIKQLNDYQNGIGTLDDLLSQAETKEDRELYFEIADKYKYRGGSDEAAVWFAKVVEAGEPTDSLTGEARTALADMKRRAKEYDAALAAFKSIETDFKTGSFAETAAVYQAIVERAKGDTTAAIAEFERYLTTYPSGEHEKYATSQIEKLKNPPKKDEK